MPVLKFRVFWEDDDNIYRDIALTKGQTFKEFNDALLKAFEFDNTKTSSFFESNDKWEKGREISSEVLVNKKDAPALSMIKTPVSALVATPDQKFVFTYDPVKKWTFLIELIGIDKDINEKQTYPYCFYKEGIAPAQTGTRDFAQNSLLEIEEKYDLGKEEMDEGYSSEGEDGGDSGEDFGGANITGDEGDY